MALGKAFVLLISIFDTVKLPFVGFQSLIAFLLDSTLFALGFINPFLFFDRSRGLNLLSVDSTFLVEDCGLIDSLVLGLVIIPAFAFSACRFNRGHLVTSGLLLCTLRTIGLAGALVLLSFFHCLSNSRLPLASLAEDPDSFDTPLNSPSVAA